MPMKLGCRNLILKWEGFFKLRWLSPILDKQALASKVYQRRCSNYCIISLQKTSIYFSTLNIRTVMTGINTDKQLW